MKNACIVGFGEIGPLHAKALDELSSVNLYGICDVDDKALKNAKERYPNVKEFKSFDDALTDPEIDSFHICTPHYLHFEMIKKALEKGKSVVTEKPVTRTKEEFDALLELEGSEKVCVNFQNRYNTCIVKLHEIMESREYGNIIGIKANVLWKRDAAYYNSAEWRGTISMEGGGVLINQAIHTLDHLLTLCGRPVSLIATTANLSLQNVIEVEDTVTAIINFKDTKGMFFATNATSYNSAPFIEILCDKARITYANGNLYIGDDVICSDDDPIEGVKNYWGRGHLHLLKDFYENNKFISPRDAKDTMDTVFAIYKSNGNEIIL